MQSILWLLRRALVLAPHGLNYVCRTGSGRAVQTKGQKRNQVLTKVGLSGIGHLGARVLAYRPALNFGMDKWP
jgi:hypothetical protein